jgi:hypothetical protein
MKRSDVILSVPAKDLRPTTSRADASEYLSMTGPWLRLLTGLVVVACAVPAAGATAETTLPRPGSGKQPITFSERSPLRTLDEIRARCDHAAYEIWHDPKSVDYDVSTESFEVVVPPNYSRGGSQKFGLFFWSGVTEFSPSWFDVLARHRLIWVSAPSVAKRNGLQRIGLPIDAVHNMKQLYDVDENRVYISGFSGGGLYTAEIVHAFPDVFRGALFINGEDFYFNSHWSEEGKLEPSVSEYPKWGGPLTL